MATPFEALLEQALELSEEERSDAGDEPSPQEWEAAWSAELDHRIREIRDGSVELVDGDAVLAELREIAGRP